MIDSTVLYVFPKEKDAEFFLTLKIFCSLKISFSKEIKKIIIFISNCTDEEYITQRCSYLFYNIACDDPEIIEPRPETLSL